MVKCADCGYLTVRNRKSRQLEETEQHIRETGIIEIVFDDSGRFHEIGSGYPRYEPPLCFIGAIDLRPETGKYGEATQERIKSAINKERECGSFTQWQQGFTPKEHREMMDRERMLKWQEEREQKDKEWREKLQRENRQETRKLTLMAGFFVLVGAFLPTLIGGLGSAISALVHLIQKGG
jgi:hypothetical protein